MHNYFIYITESSIIFGFLYLTYLALLSKETFFKTNRFILLSILILSAVLPALKINIANDSNLSTLIFMQEIEVGAKAVSIDSGINFINLITTVYLIVSSVLLVLFIKNLFRILLLTIRNDKENNGYYTKVYINEKYSIFTFFNYLFIPENKQLEPNILKHEKAHIRAKHSFDKTITELAIVVFWFNPLIWLFRKSLNENHEFFADKLALENDEDNMVYQAKLIEYVIGVQPDMVNNFNKSITLKRINMIKKVKSNKFRKFRLFAMIPVLMLSVFLFSFESNKTELGQDNLKSVKSEKVIPQNQDTLKKSEVDIMPKYPDMINYLAKNVKYPGKSMENGDQGVVYVEVLVKKDGSVGNVKILRGVTTELDREALRVVNTMKQWQPAEKDGKKVNASIVIPIKFKLK